MTDTAWRNALKQQAASWIAGEFGEPAPNRLVPGDVEAMITAAQEAGVFKATETEPLLILREWAEAIGCWHNPGEGYEPSVGDIAVFRDTTGIVTEFVDDTVSVLVLGDDPGEIIGIIDTSMTAWS